MSAALQALADMLDDSKVEPTPTVEQEPLTPSPAVDVPLALREALSLPAVWLSALPAPCTLCIAYGHDASRFYATTSQASYMALRERREVVLTGRELGCLALAAEHGRASPVWLAQWLELRRAHRDMPLDVATALGGVSAPDDERPRHPYSLGRVLHAFACTLLEVEVHV